jgi:hypothetical protein
MTSRAVVFLSYAGEDAFEATLLQSYLENELVGLDVSVWTYERDQGSSERDVARSLREHVRESSAAIVLLSAFTLASGATQWMELAYADAFQIPTFILLHHLTYDDLKRSERDVPPLVLQGQCTQARDWRSLDQELRQACELAQSRSVKCDRGGRHE